MQTIVNIRIDERLIHGQVASAWANTLKANRIMVVDDVASTDDIQKMALKMACPSSCKLSILSTERAVENILAEKYEGDRIFMVMKGPEVLVRMWDLGFKFTEINVGNMSSGFGTTQIKRSVSVTVDDVKNFKLLQSLGIKMHAQMVPSENDIDFMNLISKV